MIKKYIQKLLEIYKIDQKEKLQDLDLQTTNPVQGHLENPQFLQNINPEKTQNLAKQLFISSKAIENKGLLLSFDIFNLEIAAYIYQLAEENNLNITLDITNQQIESYIINNSSSEQLKEYSDIILSKYQNHNNYLMLRSTQDPSIKTNAENKSKFQDLTKEISANCKSGKAHYTLTIIPKKHDADLDEIPYEDYLGLFFEACDQPWSEIKEAQAYLINKFDQSRELHITNSDGTDIKLNIEGFTFANSTILKNIPGSEIFSAPNKESVNGTLNAKGKFQYRSETIIEDIELTFQDGKVTSIKASKGQAELERIIQLDDEHGKGSRFIGEIGIGTNPHIRKHLLNGLLVEKISGSFHLALGDCYTYKIYDNKPVNMDNGNHSHNKVHWDITCMLRGKDGEMHLDGELIQKNGIWLDPKLEVLNLGWGAIDPSKQPDWWKVNYPQGYTH